MTCPCCGYCQHCGRSNRPAPFYVPAPLPWQPWDRPWWVSPITWQPYETTYQPLYTTGAITITEAGPNTGVTGIKGS